MNYLPTKSAIQHSRFGFSFFLLPVYVFALSQAPDVNTVSAFLVFVIWHLLVYPASNGYNSYFDKDEGSIALLENPPATDKSLYIFSISLDVIGILLSTIVSFEFATAVLIYGVLSKLYSHPLVRLKKYPLLSFFVVFIFQGAFVYWTSYYAISKINSYAIPDSEIIIAGFICSCLIGASYPLTQIYQHDEDAKRGDKTLSMALGIMGSFAFAGILFIAAAFLTYIYWERKGEVEYFWVFICFIFPVIIVFLDWLKKVLKERSQANFKNMSRMTLISGTMMLLYFFYILLKEKGPLFIQ